MEKEDSDRPLADLSPEEILQEITRQGERRAEQAVGQERVPYLGFYLGKEVYGLPLRQLREVSRLTRVRKVPGAPSSIAGLVNLRGEIICALDSKVILNLTDATPAETRFLVVLQGLEDPLGLVVDSVADIYSVEPDKIEPPLATWPPDRAQFFQGTVRVQEGLMGLLDLDRLVAK